MQINIKATNLDLTLSTESFIKEKFSVVEKLTKNIDPGVVKLWVELSKPSRHHQRGKVFYAEANLRLPGKTLRAEESEYDLMVALDRVRDELVRQVKKYKDRKITKTRQPLE